MAAGLGFKTFTTGEVLTAADTNGYLMQGVLVFASAAARDAAITSPQEGQCCYLKDTDAVLTYSGSAWVGFDESNAIQNSIVDAKGDLVAASGADTPARLAVGSNGETLVANSAASSGLQYNANFAAGKNKIINGDFNINQRAFSSITASAQTFDRWLAALADGTSTLTAQTFTLGAAPVAGYESTNFLRLASTGQTATSARTTIEQRIEDVRTFAGQTVTVSFWAKASSGTPYITPELAQQFGSGGSAFVSGIGATKVQITTSWVRYSVAGISVPSISGKTIGSANNELRLTFWTSAGSDFNSRSASLGIQTTTIDIWGVQVEAGSVATAFQTATGTIQGELAAAQRYYVRFNSGNGYGNVANAGYTTGATGVNTFTQFPVNMRTIPTSIDSANLSFLDANGATAAVSAPSSAASGTSFANIAWTTSGATAGRFAWLRDTAGAGTGYLGFSAEL